MPRQTGLVDALKRRGLVVEVVPGWETRGNESFTPKGSVCHWTAGPKIGDRPSLAVCVNGRPGLNGPLCNVFLTRAGTAVVVAAGRANHAGSGGWRGLSGNSSVWGTEAENSGGGEWTDAQRRAYPLINAAYADLSKFNAEMVCGHNEWAPTRKIDIRDWPMSAMRSQVAALLAGTTPGDDDEMPLYLALLKNGDGRVFVGDGVTRRHVPNPTALADLQYKIRTGAFKGDPNVQSVSSLDWLGADISTPQTATVDTAAITKALTEAVTKALSGTAQATADATTKAVTTALSGTAVLTVEGATAAAEVAIRNVLRDGV